MQLFTGIVFVCLLLNYITWHGFEMLCAARYIIDSYRFYFVTLTFSFSDELF